jgi:putative ABC transport system permease protein
MKVLQKSYIELMLAWRNVWKNRRRTVLTLLTVLVGCAMIILMRAMQEGGYAQMIEDAVSTDTGDIQIHEKGFFDNESIDYAFIPNARMIRKLESVRDISAISMRVHAAGLVSSGNSTEGAVIQGVDPVREKKVTTMYKFILKGGRYLEPGDGEKIIMGETLAKNLSVKVGDTVVMLSQGFDGSIAAAKLSVVGLFRSGNPDYDHNLIIMPLEEAVGIFSMMDYVNSIVIRLRDVSHMEQVRDRLRRSIGTPDLEIMGYDQLMPGMMQYILLDRTTGYIFYAVLFLVVAFGVLNTMQMSVYERVREFGIMMAVGTRPGQVRRMVQLESMIITLFGIVLGILLGSGLSYYFTVHPLDYSSYAKEIEVWGLSTTVFPARLDLSIIVWTAILIFILSYIFTFFPARKASRLNPVEAIRKL